MEEIYNDMIALWILRLLINLRCYRRITRRSHIIYSGILRMIGLDQLNDEEIETPRFLELLKQRLSELESEHRDPQNEPLITNIEWLGDELSFTRAEKLILLFMILVKSSSPLEDTLQMLDKINYGQLVEILSAILNLPYAEIRGAIYSSSSLMSSGLITIDFENNDHLRSKLILLEGVPELLCMEYIDRDTIFDPYLHLSQHPRLSRSDYSHIKQDYDLLGSYLRSTVENGVSGVNILVYGQPGTGKTELAKTLAADRGIQLYEIATTSISGKPLNGGERLPIYQLAQRLLGRKNNCAILFDDVDDALPTTWDLFLREKRDTNKAWFNQLLEENRVPAFWISNKNFNTDPFLLNCDPAFLRRFDYALELRPPTRTMRRRILDKYLKPLPVSDTWMNQMAENEHLAPAHIEKAAKVALRLAENHDQQVETVLDHVLKNTMRVMGQQRLTMGQINSVTAYSLDYVNTDQDLESLTAGLKQHQQGRLCLYGPPGTGKTCYARNIAHDLDRPLLLKRASDILSCWVGATEKNIAKMFNQAEDEGAVLLLDEADSFLQDRNNAQRTWEITQVNELLVQMESFNGLFIASTNLMDSLDSASLRRFDLKIKFDYLHPEQALQLLTQVMIDNDWSYDETHEVRSRLKILHNLTPGDYAVVVRQAHVLDKKLNTLQFIDVLEKECLAKPGSNGKSIGFSAWI